MESKEMDYPTARKQRFCSSHGIGVGCVQNALREGFSGSLHGRITQTTDYRNPLSHCL